MSDLVLIAHQFPARVEGQQELFEWPSDLDRFRALYQHALGCDRCRLTPEDPCPVGAPLFEAAKNCGTRG